MIVTEEFRACDWVKGDGKFSITFLSRNFRGIDFTKQDVQVFEKGNNDEAELETKVTSDKLILFIDLEPDFRFDGYIRIKKKA